MQRSRTQVLFSYLPDSVFIHSTGLIVKSTEVRGDQLTDLNKRVLLSELDAYLQRWPDDRILGLPRPSRVAETEFRVITPQVLSWDVWPLRFECSREQCKRITSFKSVRDIPDSPRCPTCRGSLRQLRYYNAHECGHVKQMFTPECSNGHGYRDIYFDDTGTFRTAVFRCRGCGNAPVRRTALSPCTCSDEHGRHPMMHAYTVRDTRTYYPHFISLINLQSPTFNDFQAHAARGEIAVASYLGHLGEGNRIRPALVEADQGLSQGTTTPEEWADREAKFRATGLLSDEEIDELRRTLGPRESGLAALANVGSEIVALGQQRTLVERAALFDDTELRRITLADARKDMEGRGGVTAASAISRAISKATDLGVSEISVTWNFPVALAAFGYTRTVRERGQGKIRGFARLNAYGGKSPIFAVATETEALLITLSASKILQWLEEPGAKSPGELSDESEDRLKVLELFAEGGPASSRVTTLCHTISHIMLRALSDGQTGFAETSLAEWIVPETLTIVLYASSLKSYTLGALWTLLNNRTLQWLQQGVQSVLRCENDPLCHQAHPRACERCLYLAFGCQKFNDDLDREVLGSFWANA